MAALEQQARERHGISIATLMERAGARTADVARTLLRQRGGRRVVVLVGKGNNGGDGLVAALRLSGESHVRVLLAVPADEIRGDPAVYLQALRERFIEIVEAGTLDAGRLDHLLGDADLLVDAIFGTGFRGPAEGTPARVIQAANRSGTPILAVDVPSGTGAGSGQADPPCISAVATVTMGLPKVGLMQYPAAAYAGRIFVADIGLPASLIDEAPISAALVHAGWVDRMLRPRREDSHKGLYGHVLVIAGARGFAGAAVLCARGAIRAGAGLVTIGGPASLAAAPPASLPEAMTRALPETPAGTLSESAGDAIVEAAGGMQAVAIGPGLTTHPEVVALVRRLLPRLETPVVVDADALNALAGEPGSLRDVPGPVIITPHPGEMARLIGATTASVQRDRLGAAREAARISGAVTVLKGARTIVASPDGHAAIIPNGNPAMATGGMGDVLTGAIAALVGQQVPAFDAAACGAYLHGLAGDLAAAGRGELGLLAHEVADEIPRALARVRAGEVDDGIASIA
jgi:NAD(P)H-hydrate epimerase